MDGNVAVGPSDRVLLEVPIECLRHDFLGERPGSFQDKVGERERGDSLSAKLVGGLNRSGAGNCLQALAPAVESETETRGARLGNIGVPQLRAGSLLRLF